MFDRQRQCPFCGKTSDEPFCKCACGMLSHFLLFLTGPGLSMKSVTADHLHKFLKIGLVQSAYLGHVLKNGENDEELRAQRRNRLLSIAKVYTESNLPVIIDAAFHGKTHRYEFLKEIEQDAPNTDIVYLYCCCENQQIREIRVKDRATNPQSMEIEAMSIEEANNMFRKYESPLKDVFPIAGEYVPLIFFDTGRYRAEIINLSKRPHVNDLMVYIREEINRAAAVGQL